MVFAVWACGDPPPEGVEELEDALVASVRQARSEPEVLAHEAMDRYGYPAGFLARYFEKLRYRFGPRERARSSPSSSWPVTPASSTASRTSGSSTAAVPVTNAQAGVGP